MYKIKLTGRAKKELKNLKKTHLEALTTVLEEMKEDPLAGKILTRELTNQYSLRVGIYRIIYRINKKDKIVTVLTAGHRSTIYK